MHLFELAMELGERSAEMAEVAPSLGFDDITPTSVLTPEQVQAFRARYTKAPVPVLGGSNAYPGVQGAQGVQPAAPADWGAPPPPPPGAAGGGTSGGGGGGRIVQMAVIGVAVVGVLGLFAFMFANSGTDEKRLEKIATAEPVDEGPTVTGPNGKPLSAKEREYLAALGANEVKRQEQACAVLRQISDMDKAASRSTAGMDTFEEIATIVPTLAEQQAKANVLYDQLATLAPEQAENIRISKEVANDLIARFQAAGSDPDALRQVAQQMKTEIVPDATYQALVDLEQYGQTTCGVSMGQN